MIVVVDEKRYEFDGSLTLAEAFVLFDKAHVGIGEFLAELGRVNPHVIAALVFILKRRAKEAVRWEELLSLSTSQIQLLPDADADDEGKAPVRARTSRRGPTRTGDTPGT